MKAAFIVNSRIKRKKKFMTSLAQLEHKHVFETIKVYETEHAGHAISLAERATEKVDIVVAVGGDGTLNEVLNGFMIGSQFRIGKSAPVLAYLPYGTANDFARSTNVTTDIEAFIELVEHNQTEALDVGKIHYSTTEGDEEERYFLNIADTGIGGLVVEKVNKSKTKKVFGAGITFMRAITEAFITYEPSPIKCEADTFTWEGTVLSFVCANGKYFGNGLCIAPDAELNNGKLEIVIMADVGAKDYALNLNKLRKGEKLTHPQVHYFQARELEIIPEKYSCAIDADGEFIGNIPMHIVVLPREIQFLMPKPAWSDEPLDEE